jgi:hypothetical protein
VAHGEKQNDILFVFKRLARLEGAAVLTALV